MYGGSDSAQGRNEIPQRFIVLPFRYHDARKLLKPIASDSNDGGFHHIIMLLEYPLDLLRLDAVPANLEETISAAQEPATVPRLG